MEELVIFIIGKMVATRGRLGMKRVIVIEIIEMRS